MRAAYDAAATAWAHGPEALYGALADAMLARAPVLGTVLDVGAGTGVVGRAALRRSAQRVVATDVSAPMLGRGPAEAGPVVAEATRLPFADGAFDLAAAACVLGHLVDPGAALREMDRVAGALVASAFASGWTHPAKAVVDDVLAREGYRPPRWYRWLKDVGEPAVAEPSRFARWAHAAGLRDATVHELVVDTGVRDPADLVAWRLGMAHHAPFVASLPPDRRAAVRADAESALAGCGPVVVPLLVLTADQGCAERHRTSRRSASPRSASP